MAILFIDSFDHYAEDELAERYELTSGFFNTIKPAEGRFGTGAYVGERTESDGLQKLLSSTQATLIVGFAFRHDNDIDLPARDVIMTFHSGSLGTGSTALNLSRQLSLVITPDQKIEVHSQVYDISDANLMGQATGALQERVWYYIEFKAVCSVGAGSFEVRVNEEVVLTQTGVNTDPLNKGSYDFIMFPGRGGQIGTRDKWYDDLYIENANFLGDVHIEALVPNAIGDKTEWGPVWAAGGPFENYELVDEKPPDDDATYVLGSAVGQTDTYGFENTTIHYTDIKAIQVDLYESGEAGIGTPLVVPNLYIGGTHYDGNLGLSTIEVYRYRTEVFETNPDAAGAWTREAIDDLEVGPKIKST